MLDDTNYPAASDPSRRQFLKSAAGAVTGGAFAARLVAPQFVHAAGSDLLKVGLIGCGGRGTGAASQALRADPHVKLMAMADAFADHLEDKLALLKADEEIAGKIDVPPERRFAGFDAYRQLIDSGVDVVLLATPPHFRPIHLKAAVAAGKHVFVEKPVAVDAPGVRSVLETCELARQKGLSVVSGLQYRYSRAFQQAVRRLHDGAIGEIVAVQANDYRSTVRGKERRPEWSDMEWQMRNWYYYTWLSGDFNVEQHVHMLDISSWVLGRYPERASGVGGRQARSGPNFGHIYDHFSVTYEYASGARLFATTRQMVGVDNNIGVNVLGTRGRADLVPGKQLSIASADPKQNWSSPRKADNPAQAEHDALFASIRQGTPINNGDYMSQTTLLAIQGRMSAYTGKTIGWEQALNSQEDLSPREYAWGPLPEPAVAVPGVTKFV